MTHEKPKRDTEVCPTQRALLTAQKRPMNSPDHTDRLLGLHHNQRPHQQQQSALFPISGGAMPPPEMQMQLQMLGGSSTMTTSAPDCQQKPQHSSPPVENDCVDLTTSDSSEDISELSSLLVLYNHDLDRVQRHLEGALQHTQTQQDQLQLSRMAELEARKQGLRESANDASLADSLAAFVGTGAADHNSKQSNSSAGGGGGGPETMIQLPNNQTQQDMMLANQQHVMTQPQQQQQQQPRGSSSASSSSPGILSYTGTIKTALGPSQAPSSSLLDMARRRSSLNPTGDDGCSAGSSSISISMSLGTQAQAQASYGVDAPFSAGANNIGMNAGAAGANGAAVSVVMQQQQANINRGNGTTMMAGPPAPSSLSMMPSNRQNATLRNINDAMINGDNAMAGGLNLGRLIPPTHPSAHANGGQDNSLLSHNSSCAQQNTFQQQQQQQLQQQHQQSNFSIGPSALMGESLTTLSPFDMGSIPSMPQSVLSSQSVGSVQSTISFASTGSASMTNDLGNNRANGRMVGGGGFLGPGRARGPGGIGIHRAKRSRARSNGSNSSSIDAGNSMAAKSNIQALLRSHASIGGKQPNAEGMCPIHIACRDYPTNARLIGTMLCTSPGVGRSVVGRGSSVGAQVTGRRPSPSSTNSGESSRSNTIVMEGSYPIHIALAYSANVDVVKLLVRQNPELLIKGDGTNRVPLSIAFSYGASLEVLDLLLGMNPNAAAIPDLRNNFPLHLACARRMGGGGGQINLPLLKRLVEAFSAAVHKCNFNGKTPLELAQDGGLTDDDAISYLHEMAYMERDDDVIEAPDAS